MELDGLEAAMDRAAHADPSEFSDRASIVRLQRVRAQLECVVARAVACFAESGTWASEGAKDAEAWLATRCHLPRGEARAQVRRGAALSSLPVVTEAFADGEIGPAQVDAVARVQAVVDPGIVARDEVLLVDMATSMKFGAFNAALGSWTQYADPLGAEAAELAKESRRSASVSFGADGMVHLRADLAAISGTIVADEFTRRRDELFEADWEKAKADLGRDPTVGELGRTHAQRGADALVEMAIRSSTAPPEGRRPEPLFSVVVDYPSLSGRICQLENGQVVPPGALVPFMDEATFERIVFTPGNRAEVSVKARFFTGATRRAIEVRDRQCTHEFCELPAEWCQIDHIVPYAHDGETVQDNGQVLCGFHNRLRNAAPKPKTTETDTETRTDTDTGRGVRSTRDGPEPGGGEHGPEPGG